MWRRPSAPEALQGDAGSGSSPPAASAGAQTIQEGAEDGGDREAGSEKQEEAVVPGCKQS